MALPVSFAVELKLDGVNWTAVTADVVADPSRPVRAIRGITRNGPSDRVAGTGTLEFTLRNDNHNSGATRGWYSPNNSNVRTGFTFGIATRLRATYNATTYTLWVGKLFTVLPDSGLHQNQNVRCIATDCIADLADFDVREVSVQLSQTESQLLTTVIAALPASAQPVGTSFDTGLDTYPYAFDNMGTGQKALYLITTVIQSALGYLYPNKDGTLRYENRRARPVKASSFTFTDPNIYGLTVPSSMSNVFNRVRMTYHQRTIDAAATTVLFAGIDVPALDGGASVTIWGTYFVASNTLKLIGGTAQVTPIVATTDYTANSASDGSGSDLTANISVVTTAFASTVKFVITNNGGTKAYITKYQVRGKGIYDNAPSTAESFLTQSYGDRVLAVDLFYQNDANVAQDLADYVRTQYQTLLNQIDDIVVYSDVSDALLAAFFAMELGDVVTISETVTGLSSVKVAIQGIELECSPGQFLHARLFTAPALLGNVWILDDAVASLLGTSTVLGYA